MSGHLDELFGINYVIDNYIYTTNFIWVIYEVSLPKNDENILDELIDTLNLQAKIIITKSNASFVSYEEYFNFLIEKNIYSKCFRELLLYISNFKNSISDYSSINTFIQFAIKKEDSKAEIEETFNRLGIVFKSLDRNEIENLFKQIFNVNEL